MRELTYYGRKPDRYIRIQPGTVWLPTNLKSDRKPRSSVKVIRRMEIPGVEADMWRVELVPHGVEPGKSDRRTTASFASFIKSYHREDETVVPRVSVPSQGDGDQFEAMNKLVLRLHARLIRLENFLKQLGYTTED